MLHETEIWKYAEAVANGTITPKEQQTLNTLLANETFSATFHENLSMIQDLNAQIGHKRFKAMLKDIHNETQSKKTDKKALIINLFSNSKVRIASVAAGVALVSCIGTMLLMQQSLPKTSTHNIQNLGRDINALKQTQRQQQILIQNIKDQQASEAVTEIAPSNYSGTGFALSNDGYVITNYHVTDGADSLYIQTRDGNYHKARLVAFEPKTDVALLKVEDKHFKFGKGEVPYTFAASKLALGSRVYTLGFPQNEIVYNEGYVSARNGFEGDSAQYRLEIPAAAGQSGSPVLDNNGNIIGIIKAKDDQTAGTTYAVSSKAFIKLLNDLNTDIKLNKSNKIGRLSREQQVEKIQDYTCMIQVYKH